MRQHAAHEVCDQIRAQCPARAEIAEYPGHVRHAREHHAAIGDGVGEIERPAVDSEGDVAEDAEVEAGRGDDDVGFKRLSGFQENSCFDETVDLVGDDGGLAALDAVEQIGAWYEGDALSPWPVARREMRGDIVI